MKTALERTHSPDAETRHTAVVALGREDPSEEAAARLITLLDDHAEVCVSEGSSIHDVEPTYSTVSAAARESLRSMGAFLWPAIAPVWATSSANARHAMLTALAAQPLDRRAQLPDEAHALFVEDARTIGVAQKTAIAEWERAFAARVRRGELADPEAFWRAAHDHPSPDERDRSFVRLAPVASDPVALARELLGELQRKDVWHQSLVTALTRLPPVMPASIVQSIISSDLVEKYPQLWAWLARHEDAARSLLPICLAVLAPGTLGGRPWSNPTMLNDRRWSMATDAIRAFGPLAPDVRALLLDRLATTNEMMSIEGSLRKWWCELLGDAARIEAELEPRLVEMEQSSDPVAIERARQLRRRFAAMQKKS